MIEHRPHFYCSGWQKTPAGRGAQHDPAVLFRGPSAKEDGSATQEQTGLMGVVTHATSAWNAFAVSGQAVSIAGKPRRHSAATMIYR